MTGATLLPRRFILMSILLPIAGLLGYLLATPQDLRTVGTVGLVIGLILVPIVLRWHHAVLVFAWNASIEFYFLPGRPALWILMAMVSLAIVIVNRGLDRSMKLIHVPSLTVSMVLIAIVALVTADLTGGMGIRTAGSSNFGGKKYFIILFAIMGYFAMSLQPIAREKAVAYTGAFILSPVTAAVSALVYYVPSLWLFYYVFPIDLALTQMADEMQGPLATVTTNRLTGVGIAATAITQFMLMRYGVRGHLILAHPWRLPLLLLAMATSLLGGFRSMLIIQLVLIAALFHLEGLTRTRALPVVLLVSFLGLVGIGLVAQRLPLSLQRALSVFPIPVDAAARMDAEASSDWRLRMWEALLPEVPKHFWLGKGFTANATDYYLVFDSVRRGFAKDYEASLLAGDYHNGPLSVIIPFGIWGMLAFLGFVVSALRVLYHNHRYGDPELQRINTFLLGLMITKLAFFTLIYGSFPSDLAAMAGVTALSISLNGGVRQRPESVL